MARVQEETLEVSCAIGDAAPTHVVRPDPLQAMRYERNLFSHDSRQPSDNLWPVGDRH